MDFPASLFPAGILWPANALLIVLLAAALVRLPLGRLRSNEFMHVYLAGCVVLLLLWNTRVGVLPALIKPRGIDDVEVHVVGVGLPAEDEPQRRLPRRTCRRG